jgi:hypothetical protein
MDGVSVSCPTVVSMRADSAMTNAVDGACSDGPVGRMPVIPTWVVCVALWLFASPYSTTNRNRCCVQNGETVSGTAKERIPGPMDESTKVNGVTTNAPEANPPIQVCALQPHHRQQCKFCSHSHMDFIEYSSIVPLGL